jgi:hypothetical protein
MKAAGFSRLGDFQPLQIEPVALDVGEVVCACCTSQPCSLPPKTFDSLTAISGETPRLPFTSSESVLRETPRAWAAPVIVKPIGSMQSSNTTARRCGGSFMVIAMGCFLSVVIILAPKEM